jgi:hypothetical protein
MNLFGNLRVLVMLRRIARALESLAESQRELAEAARNRRLASEARRARKAKPTEIGAMDIKAAEERFKAMHPELELDEVDDDI